MRCHLWPSSVLAVLLCLAAPVTAQPKQPPLVDQYGDPLPKHGLLRLGTTRMYHQGKIRAAFIAPDGKSVTVVGEDGHVVERQPATGKKLSSFRLEPKGDEKHFVARFALSSDGQLLAGNTRAGVCLWDAKSGKLKVNLTEELKQDNLLKPQFTADGKALMVLSATGKIIRFDLAAGKDMASVELETPKKVAGIIPDFEQIYYASFSADGNLLAGSTSTSEEVFLWDTATGKLVKRLPAPGFLAGQPGFSPDGKFVAAGCGSVRVWSVTSGEMLPGLSTPGDDFAFSADSKQLVTISRADAASFDDVLHFVDLASGKKTMRKLQEPGLPLGKEASYVFSADGKLLVGHGNTVHGISSRLYIWDIATGKLLGKGHDAPVPLLVGWVGATFAPDGRSLYITDISDIHGAHSRQYAFPGGKLVRSFPGILQKVIPDGSAVLTRAEMTLGDFTSEGLHRFEVATGKLIWKHPVRRSLTGAQFSQDATRIAIETDENKLKLLDATTGKLLENFPPLSFKDIHSGDLSPVRDPSVMISPDLKYAALGDPKKKRVRIMDWSSATIVRDLQGLSSKYYDLVFSPDCELLLGINGGTNGTDLVLWNIATGEKWASPPKAAYAGFSPDGKLLALNSKSSVLFWDVSSRQTLSIASVSGKTGLRLSFAPDAKFAAVPGVRGVKLVEVATGQQLLELESDDATVVQMEFAPDCRSLLGVTGSSVLAWDVTGHYLALSGKARQLAPGDFPPLWDKLAAPKAATAVQAMWDLVAAGDDAVAVLAKALPPDAVPDAKQVKKLIDQLDSEDFNTREKAKAQLLKMPAALPLLRDEKMAKGLLLEGQLRLDKIVEAFEHFNTSPAELRRYRTLQALEYIGTPKARALLQQLADGAPGTLLTREAQASLKRLAKKAA